MSTLSRICTPLLALAVTASCRADTNPPTTATPAPTSPASAEPSGTADAGWCTNVSPLLYDDDYDLYSSAGVSEYFEAQTGQSPPGPSGLENGAATFDLTASSSQYRTPLTVGTVELEVSPTAPSPALDTGSPGITVSCEALFAGIDGVDCSNLPPQFVAAANVYVTDLAFSRCYGGSDSKPNQGTRQSGVIAVASVTLGSVSAPMPVALVTEYATSSGPNPQPESTAIVGVNSASFSGMVSPILYFDYGASPTPLDPGFVVDDSPALTIGVDPTQLDGFTLQTLDRLGQPDQSPPWIPGSVWDKLAKPTLSTSVSVAGSSDSSTNATLEVLFDTGTAGAGHLVTTPTVDCEAGCTVTAQLGQTTVVTLDGVDMKFESTGHSIVGLDFMTGNQTSDRFLVVFDTSDGHLARAGFASTAP